MRCCFESLRPADRSAIDSVPDGLFLVRARAETVLPDSARSSRTEASRWMLDHRPPYCTARAMWKLTWFLRDFGYDAELLGKDKIDDQALVRL
jgi:hypothetical protein